MSQPFAGIRVVDFTQVLAGPFATQQLAQHGAEVIKVEPPGSGDMTRNLMKGQKGSPSFVTCNIGKKSLTLDLKGPAAAPVMQRLLATADVLVQSFRPGVMTRLGLGYEAVREIKPDIVYCSISGFGQTGPASHLPAFDGAIQAASGMMAITGHPETGPTRTGYMPVDMATGLNASFAISAALYRRLASGAGQHIDVAMMDTAMVLQASQVSAYLIGGAIPELFGNRSPTRAPTANVFEAADGYLQIVALKEPQVAALFTALGIGERLADFDGGADRIERTAEINALLEPILRGQTVEYWLAALETAGVPAAAIRDYPAVTADPQFEGRPIFATTEVEAGERVRVVGAAHTTSEDPPHAQRPAPELSEHTDEILAELGFDATDIDGWRAAQAI
ncbi:MAG: CoA transferase [Pseudomonadota bacterium]